VMSLTFVVVGACVLVTGLALRPARAAGRLILMAGAVAGMLVAANPEHPGTSLPVPHMICAAAGCAGVVAWPTVAWRRGPSVPWGLRPAVSAGAVAVLLALVAWFGAELITGGGLAGLAERSFGAALALWPLTVVASCRYATRKDTRLSLNRLGARPARFGVPAAGVLPCPIGGHHRLYGQTELHDDSSFARHRNARSCHRSVVRGCFSRAVARNAWPGTAWRACAGSLRR